MSLHGFHNFNPMGFPPSTPRHAVHHSLPPISVADDSTFDAWMALPPTDHRTLDEFAGNPVVHPTTYEFFLPRLPLSAPIITGTLRSSLDRAEHTDECTQSNYDISGDEYVARLQRPSPPPNRKTR